MIQSKFNRGSLVKIIISLSLILFLLLAVLFFFHFDSVENIAIMGLFIFIVCLFLVWIIYGECRTKALKATIGHDTITIRNYFGLGKEKTFYFSNIQGYKIEVLSTEYTDYEYIYLISDGRRVIKFSEWYHANYPEIKAWIISSRLPFLGREKFNFAREMRDIFR